MAQKVLRTISASGEPPALPFDVLCPVLALLPQTDLRNAAAASRTFRGAAKQVGLYIHRTIIFDMAVDIGPDVEILTEVIERARTDDCRISLEVFCPGRVPWTSAQLDMLHSRSRDGLNMLVDCVCCALRYLVFLRVTAPEFLRMEVDAVLLMPAPHLETFEIRDIGPQGSIRSAPLVPLPADLFAGTAPKLRRVSLEYIPLAVEPISTFSHVEHAHLQHEDVFPETDLARHFPQLCTLHVTYHRSGKDTPPPACIFRGLHLRKLIVDVKDEEYLLPAIAREIDLSSIPEIECRGYAGCGEVIWAAPACAADNTELCAQMTDRGGCDMTVEIDVTSRRAEWHCKYLMDNWDLNEPYPLFGEPLGIVSLRLENKCLPSILESGVAFPCLRELRIDLCLGGAYAEMIWPLAWGVALREADGGTAGGIYSVPCPSLVTLEIVALSASTEVRDSEVIELGDALGQRNRKDGVRAQLVLRGVLCSGSELGHMFQTVRSFPFTEELHIDTGKS